MDEKHAIKVLKNLPNRIPLKIFTETTTEEIDQAITIACDALSDRIQSKDKQETKDESELEKIYALKGKAQLCGDFLNFLIKKYDMFDRNQPRELPYYIRPGDYIYHERVLAEFFDIDLNKVNNERQELIEQLRHKNTKITKPMIEKGLRDEIIHIIKNENDDAISAKIGDNWFYFCDTEDEELSIDDFKNKHDIKAITNLIYRVINDEPIKGPTEDDSNEWLYYKAILQIN